MKNERRWAIKVNGKIIEICDSKSRVKFIQGLYKVHGAGNAKIVRIELKEL